MSDGPMQNMVGDNALARCAVALIRCRRTNRYFTGQGWSAEPWQAETYQNEDEAARACVLNDLHEVELVLRGVVSGIELFRTALR